MVPDSPAQLLPENRSALKEWASIEVALEQGTTVLMLRKGGIYEQKQGFQVEHRQFWLFPTLFHQGADELAPTFEWTIRAAEERAPAGNPHGGASDPPASMLAPILVLAVVIVAAGVFNVVIVNQVLEHVVAPLAG
jgi:hypothetical protein